MNKTLLQKLTSKAVYPLAPHSDYRVNESLFTGMVPEMNILERAAKDLLSPRKEAIEKLLEMSRGLS